MNLVKYLHRVKLDASINWHYLHLVAGKTCSEISKMRSYWKYSKSAIRKHMKKKHWRPRGYEKIIREEHQNCLFHKINILRQNKRDGEHFYEKIAQKSNGKSRYSTIH